MMRHHVPMGLCLVTTAALVGCSVEDRAQRLMDAAIADLDPEVFTNAEGHASKTGDGPFPDPDVSLFEVTLVEGADLEEAGAQLNMLREDHEISADVRIDEDKVIWTEENHYDASVLTDQQWADVLEFVLEEDLTRGSLIDDGDSEETYLVLNHESEDYDESTEALLSWQDLEAPEGITGLRGAIDVGGPGTDIPVEEPHIQLSAPIGDGEKLLDIVHDASGHHGWQDIDVMDLWLAESGGARMDLSVYLDDHELSVAEFRRQLVEDPGLFRTAEDFADRVQDDLTGGEEMSIRIQNSSSTIDLVARGSYAGDITPEERNANIVESDDES